MGPKVDAVQHALRNAAWVRGHFVAAVLKKMDMSLHRFGALAGGMKTATVAVFTRGAVARPENGT